MTTLALNTAGSGHSWGEVLASKVHAARGQEPGESAYAHAVGRALDQLIGPYRNKPIITALIEKLIDECAAVESALWQVRDSRGIDLAKTDALLMLGRLIQVTLHSRFADSTLQALLDNHAKATPGGENWADLERWILTFFDSVALTESGGAAMWLALSNPTAAMLDIADWKIDAFEGYVASSLTEPATTPAGYDASASAEGIYVDADRRLVTTVNDTFARLFEMGVPGQMRSIVQRATVNLDSLIIGANLQAARYDVNGKWLFVCDNRYVYKLPTVTPFSPEGITEVDEMLDTAADTGGVSLIGLAVASTGQAIYVTTGTTIYQYNLDAPHRFYDDFGGVAYTMSGTLAAATGAKGIEVSGSGERLYQNNIPGTASARIWMSTFGTAFDITTCTFTAATGHLMGLGAEIAITHEEDTVWYTASGLAIAFEFGTPGSFPTVAYQMQDACSSWGPFTQATSLNCPTSGGDYVHANGVNQRMTSTNAGLLAAFNAADVSVAFRAQRTKSGATQTLLALSDSGGVKIKIGWNASNQLTVSRGGVGFVAPPTIDGEQHSYSIIFNGAECTVCIDGVEYAGAIGTAAYTLTSAALFWTGASEHFEGRLYSWAVFAGHANSIQDLNAWAMGMPWPAFEYFSQNLAPEITAGVLPGTTLSVAMGDGMHFSDALDPPETDSGTYFAIEGF